MRTFYYNGKLVIAYTEIEFQCQLLQT